MIVQLLRVILAVESVAQGQEQQTLRRLHDAAAKMQAAGDLGLLAEDHLDFVKPRKVRRQLGPRQRRAVTYPSGLGKTKIDGAVRGEPRIQHQVE
jgi:hypothetical protein